MMKKRTIVVVAVILCFVCNMTAMAFSRADDYAIGPNETEMIASYVPGTSVVRLNTRPRSGGELTVTLNGAVNASASFPYYTSRTSGSTSWQSIMASTTRLSTSVSVGRNVQVQSQRRFRRRSSLVKTWC